MRGNKEIAQQVLKGLRIACCGYSQIGIKEISLAVVGWYFNGGKSLQDCKEIIKNTLEILCDSFSVAVDVDEFNAAIESFDKEVQARIERDASW